MRSTKHSFLIMMLLVVTTWPAPIPVSHTHENGLLSNRALFQHLVVYHSGSDETKSESRAAHFHWVFVFGNEAQDECFPDLAHDALLTSTNLMDVQSQLLELPILFLPNENFASAVSRQPVPGNDMPFGSFDTGTSKRTLFCVWNC